jgi:F0F1-type ATP synthase assembly protein I
MTQPEAPKPDRKRYAINLTLAAMAGQVGCVTLVIILVALVGGMWLDSVFNTRPWISVALLVVSVPVALYVMWLIASKAIAKILVNLPPQDPKNKDT